MVAGLVGLADRMERCDVVVTGEGHLDPPSFQGKVPGGVLSLARGRCPVLCIVGAAEPEFLGAPPSGMDIISLEAQFGRARSRKETAALIAEVTMEALPRFCP
jgi:glycerate kinase